MAKGHQVNNVSLPAHMRRRGLQSGPVLGVTQCICLGPIQVGAGDANRTLAFRIPGQGPATTTQDKIRLIALSWTCGAVSGAGPVFDIGAGVSGAFVTLINSAAAGLTIPLDTTPSGIAYFNAAAGNDRLLKNATAPITDPAVQNVAMRIRVTGGGQTAANLCFMLYFWTTSHLNLNPLDD